MNEDDPDEALINITYPEYTYDRMRAAIGRAPVSLNWFTDPVTRESHQFKSMHGTDSCWHCDHDSYHHNSPPPKEDRT